MNVTRAKRPLAALLLVALAACSAPGNGSNAVPGPVSPQARSAQSSRGASALFQRFVGVGDSLTAGYQAGGFLGATNVKNPLVSGNIVRPGQENGWWADVDEQASGLPLETAIAREYDPAVSPLPLIAGPGLNNQLVPAPKPAPFGMLKSGDACTDDNGFNAAGYVLRGLPLVRMNPNSTTLRDLGVPGITLHEANTLTMPQSPTCESLPGIPGLLSAVVGGESSTYWPVLGNFARMGSNLTMVKAAASLHPTYATVWLGANDLLKYMGSGGLFVGGDNTVGQTQQDVHDAVLALRASGAKVIVADLPNVLQTPYFMRVTIPTNPAVSCAVQTYVYCLLLVLGFPQPVAQLLTTQMATSYHLDTPAGCKPATTTQPCGYLTLQGSLTALAYFLQTGKLPDLDNGHPGSGLGMYYITPVFAGKIQALNNTINTGIKQAAAAQGSPLVDVAGIFEGIAQGKPSNPYFQKAVSISPGICCTLVFEGGLVSFDGLHPSNTGYALLAYYFIQKTNAFYHTNIPEIDVTAAYNGTRCSNKKYCFPDVYAPPYNQAAVRGAGTMSPLTALGLPDKW